MSYFIFDISFSSSKPIFFSINFQSYSHKHSNLSSKKQFVNNMLDPHQEYLIRNQKTFKNAY